MTSDPSPDVHPTSRNIQAIVESERRSKQHNSVGTAVGERVRRLAGSPRFALLNIAGLGGWVWWNAYAPPHLQFDPYPYGLLAVVVSVESVLLAIFVLVAQNRMSQQADRRDHLHLQIALLTEQELTFALRMLRRLSERLQVPPDAAETAREERFYDETNLNELMTTLEQALPDSDATGGATSEK